MFVSCGLRVLLFLLWAGNLSIAFTPDTNYDPITNKLDTVQMSAFATRHFTALTAPEQLLPLCQLQPGHRYTLFLNDPGLEAIHTTQMRMASPGRQLSGADAKHLRFVARSDCEEILLYNSNFSAPYDLVLSLGCDDCADPKASVQAPISSRAARIETAEGTPANTLIQDVFIGGDCFDVDDNSITFTGENNARGTFSSGTDVIDIETGVLLSTGRVATAQGPNL
ncbi:MAG: hypothetical protein AAF990_20530, partial [Bacteroidota bacterium]